MKPQLTIEQQNKLSNMSAREQFKFAIACSTLVKEMCMPCINLARENADRSINDYCDKCKSIMNKRLTRFIDDL